MRGVPDKMSTVGRSENTRDKKDLIGTFLKFFCKNLTNSFIADILRQLFFRMAIPIFYTIF